MTKRFVALARVSSREQEREGFSLEVQEEALASYARRERGEIVKLFRIAETATKPDERRTFKEVIAYTRTNAGKIDGLLFFKVDRAARNLFDYVELERLELDYHVPVVYVSQPTENSPAGRMMRRTLANMASFYTEQQSLDVKDGLNRRVQAGMFSGKPPYGYTTVRRDGRSVVIASSEHGHKIPKIFEIYAYQGHTLDSLRRELAAQGIENSAKSFEFTRSKLHTILRDRSYIGEIRYHDQWYPGTHPALVNRSTFDRVQVLLGECTYQSHELLYAGELIRCAHCGFPITGERKIKPSKRGSKQYVYYRCSKYNEAGHPRIRLREGDLDEQALAIFRRMRIAEDGLRDWFGEVLRAKARDQQQADQLKLSELQRQLSLLRGQQDRLLNLRLLDEIDESTFASKGRELRDRVAQLDLLVQAHDRGRAELAELAQQAFELSQTLEAKWFRADLRAKRRLLEIVCLNFSLDGASLIPTMRKPFDVLVEGLSVPLSRGDRI